MSRKHSNAKKNAIQHAKKKERRANAQKPSLPMRVLNGDMPLPKGARGRQLRKQVKALKAHLAAQAS